MSRFEKIKKLREISLRKRQETEKEKDPPEYWTTWRESSTEEKDNERNKYTRQNLSDTPNIFSHYFYRQM